MPSTDKPYGSYRDGNGAVWRVFWDADVDHTVSARVADDSPVLYEESTVSFSVPLTGTGESLPTQADELIELQRAKFIKLREKIDSYSAEHSGQALHVEQIDVQGSAPRPKLWLCALGLLGIAAMARRGR
jgi:hypothetical protein